MSRSLFDVNVYGLLDTSRQFLPLIRQSHGRLINIGSVAGKLATQGYGIYSASKFALEAFSDALRVELATVGT